MKAVVRGKPWIGVSPPKKILAMRFQAIGDTVITLPYLQSLKRQHPETELHFLTRKEVSPIPKNVLLFDKVITIRGGRYARLQFFLALLRLPWLWSQRYDAVLDLQNHKISRIIRKLLFTKGWVEFDSTSAISAGERTLQTIEALGLCKIRLDTKFILRNGVDTVQLLTRHGWKCDQQLVVLNPAGYSSSRNWPLDYYVEFAKIWIDKIHSSTQFALLLIPALEEKASYIKRALGDRCIDLTGRANQLEAFAIIQKSKLVLSEDSGLMHMAWIQGVPTLALFSSSRKDWSAPQGKWSACLDSSDMECGPCMLEVCKFGDNRCLVRYSPAHVVERSLDLLLKNK